MKSGCKDRKKVLYFTNSLSEKYHPRGRKVTTFLPGTAAPHASRQKSRRTYLYINNNINHGKFVIFGRTNTIRHERDPCSDDFGLRPLRADDAPDIFTAIDTQREHLGRWLPFVAATHRGNRTRRSGSPPCWPTRPTRSSRCASGIPSRGLSGSNRRTAPPSPSRSAMASPEYQGRGTHDRRRSALAAAWPSRGNGMENVEIKCRR